MLEHLPDGTTLVDAVIVFTLAEGIALAVYRHLTGRGIALRDFGLNLVSGLLLMCALRSTLAGTGWPWLAGFLAASGAAHAADIYLRWKR